MWPLRPDRRSRLIASEVTWKPEVTQFQQLCTCDLWHERWHNEQPITQKMVSDINHQSGAGQPLITAAEQTFVRPLWTSTDRPRLNWQGPLNCVYDAWSIASKPLRRRLGVMIMYWSDCDGWPLRIYKWSSRLCRGIVQIWPSEDKGTMLSAALFYLLAAICSARWTHALPLYPDTNLEPQAGENL